MRAKKAEKMGFESGNSKPAGITGVQISRLYKDLFFASYDHARAGRGQDSFC